MPKRAAKILGLIVVIFLGLTVLCLAALFVLASSEGVRDWALAKAREEMAASAGLQLHIGEVQGSLLTTLRFKDLSISQKERTFFKVREAELGIHLLPLLGGRLRVSPVRLLQPELDLPLQLEVAQSEDDSMPPLLALTVARVEIVDGLVRSGGAWGPLREIAGIQAKGRFMLDARGTRANLTLSQAVLALPGGRLRASAEASLRDQRLDMDNFSLTSGQTSLQAQGRLNWHKGLDMKLRAKGRLADYALLPLAWPGPQPPAAPLDFELSLEGAPEKCRVIAGLSLAGGRIDGVGLLDLTTPSGRLEAGFQRFDPLAWGLSPLALQATGRAEISSQGKPGSEAQQASLDLKLSGLSLMQTKTSRLDLRAQLAGGLLTVADLSAAGDWGSLGGKGSLRLPRAQGPLGVEADLSFQDLTAPPGLVGQLPAGLSQSRLRGSLRARGDSQNLDLVLALGSSQISPHLSLEALEAEGGLRGGAWWLKLFRARGAWGEIQAQGSLDEKTVDLGFSLNIPELAEAGLALAGWGIAAPDLHGSLQAEGGLKGPWPSAKWRLSALSRDLAGYEAFVEKLEISASGEGWRPPRGKLVATFSQLTSGEHNWDQARLELSALTSLYDFNLQAHSPDGWDLSLSADAKAALDWPRAVNLRRFRMQKPGMPAWVQEGAARLEFDRDHFAIAGLGLRAGEQRVSLSGQWQGVGQASAQCEIKGLKLRPLFPEQPVPAGAVLDATARLSGSLQQPELSLAGSLDGLARPGLPPSRVELSGEYKDQLLSLKGRAYTSGQPTFDLQASLGVELSLHPPVLNLTQEGLRASASSDSLPLALLNPVIPALSGIRGMADMRLRASGSLEEPYLSGTLELKKAAFTVSATSQRFEQVDLALRLEGQRVMVQRAGVKSGGDMEFTGWFDLPQAWKPRFNLDMRASQFKLSLGDLGDSQFDAAMQLRGSWQEPLITGSVRPLALRVQVGMGPPSDLEDEVVVLKPGQKPPPMDRHPKSMKWVPDGFLGKARVDLAADVSKGLRVALDDGWLEAAGAMRLKKEPGGPFTYHGVITVKRGLVLLLGKRFDIRRGRVDFADRDEANPLVDAAVSLQAGKILAQISVTGDAVNPHVQISSEPPMSQADILSTIIFGRPAQSLDQGQSGQLSAQALALLGQRGAREIGQILSPQLAPDVVTVHQEVQYGSSLEAGKYLSSDLYLRYRHNLSQEGGQNVGLEYRINDWLGLESQIGDARDSGVDMVYTFDFD
ncbi:hypothetical protein AAU61_08615 [Desulfocarbo indianensis]|nr:hypothetical protein AAU61_08615 [Desulfocarbo indianensis]